MNLQEAFKTRYNLGKKLDRLEKAWRVMLQGHAWTQGKLEVVGRPDVMGKDDVRGL